MKGLTTNEVAKAANVNIETIRYYERKGLIPIQPRTPSGYRVFSEAIVSDIRFIKSAQALGFTLQEIKMLMMYVRESRAVPSEKMFRFALSKITEIQQKIDELEKLKALLESVTELPDLPLPTSDCPVLKRISEDARGCH